MQIQKSFKDDNAKLYLVSTPIGNLEDMTFRAVKVLENVDIVFAEDTRVSSKLIYNHLGIKVTLESYHEHNKHVKGEKIIEHLKNGDNVALISDAGMPCISDPGYEVVKLAIENSYDVVPIPGANASLTALIASGLSTAQFCFFGFLDRNKTKRIKQLSSLETYPITLIFYESPHRIEATLKGEMVIIVEGQDKSNVKQFWENMSILEHIEYYKSCGESDKESIKKVAKDRGLVKNDVYKVYHN